MGGGVGVRGQEGKGSWPWGSGGEVPGLGAGGGYLFRGILYMGVPYWPLLAPIGSYWLLLD